MLVTSREEVFVVYSTPMEIDELAARFERRAAELMPPDQELRMRSPARPPDPLLAVPDYSSEFDLPDAPAAVPTLRMFVFEEGGLRTVEVRGEYERRRWRTARRRRRALALVQSCVFSTTEGEGAAQPGYGARYEPHDQEPARR